MIESDFVPVERADKEYAELGMLESIRRTALIMLIEISETVSEIEKVLRDQKIEHRKAVRIRKNIDAAERAIITLREHARQITGC